MSAETPPGWRRTGVLDQLFDVLSDYRRRSVLRELPQQKEIGIPELAERIAAGETGDSEQEITDHKVSEIETSLYHSHVPKLVNQGLLQRAETRNAVALSNRGTAVVDVLDTFVRVCRIEGRNLAFDDT